ncbi:hypothetical protein AJ80_06608 [Polytolypa hystricis UAMH7299]|uniref:DNA (cytosine-5-)-methyltransferase n=1 Tax=Polytolypa hystricis (strain UAMH7299) TaxID=1447883 RepID=A0A2B7XM00_POLH7|nr:hypothetical protein AJ80_06608 [Polytolypa hystricis UAMH7299]
MVRRSEDYEPMLILSDAVEMDVTPIPRSAFVRTEDLMDDITYESDDSATISAGDDSHNRAILDFERNFSSDDYMADEDFDDYVTALSLSSIPVQREEASPAAAKQRSIILKYHANGKCYKKGKSVELYDGTFLKIQQVLLLQGDGGRDEIFLQGWHFQRNEDMESLAPQRLNELCLIVDLPVDEAPQNTNPMTNIIPLYEVRLQDVKGFRIIRLTNCNYANMNVHTQRGVTSEDELRREGLLFCRMKYIRVLEQGQGRRTRVVEEAILSLTAAEADAGFSVDANTLRLRWRGGTTPGGSYRGYQAGRAGVVDLEQSRQQYTFGDGFCGAGGVSRGALQAGLRVSWGYDKCAKAMQTYRLNFDTAVGETCEVAHFLTNNPQDIRVDIMHASPPCQTFSPAKTVACAADDDNEACIFSVLQLVLAVRPRVVTMEETAGLPERHKEFLWATVHTFIEHGYSVRWKVLNCKDYGVPQTRKRLVMIASGPGESLPPFPKPSHGPPESGLLPYRTIHDAISSIPPDTPDHDLNRASRSFIPKSPLDPHSFAKTITCNGGEYNYHPSGLRSYTHREFACMQTFPLEHRFCGVGVVKQIGNAVPPMLAKAVFREIVKDLQRTDGFRGGRSG